MIRNDDTQRATKITHLTRDQQELYLRTRRQLDELVEELINVEKYLESLGQGNTDIEWSDLSLAIAEAEIAMGALTSDDGAHGSGLTSDGSDPSTPDEPSAGAVDEIQGLLVGLGWLAQQVYRRVEEVAAYGEAPSAQDLFNHFQPLKNKDVAWAINELIAAKLIHNVSDGYELRVQD